MHVGSHSNSFMNSDTIMHNPMNRDGLLYIMYIFISVPAKGTYLVKKMRYKSFNHRLRY